MHTNVNNTEAILIKIFDINKKWIALKAIKNIDVGTKQYKKWTALNIINYKNK